MKTSYLLFSSENCYVMEYSEQESLRIMIILMNVIIQGVNNFSSGITQTSGFQLGVILPARGQWQCLQTFLVIIKWGMLLASRG